MNIVIAGATGLVGGLVLKEILTKKNVSITTLTRRELKTDPDHHNLIIDWDSWKATSFEADIFICCLGTTIKDAGSKENFKKVDYEYVKLFAQSAKQSRAQKFIFVSANGADPDSRIFYNQVKGEAETMLQSFDFPSLALLRPSLLIGDRKEKRPMEQLAQEIAPYFDFLLQGPFKKYQTIHASKVAHVITSLCTSSWNGLKIVESDEMKDTF